MTTLGHIVLYVKDLQRSTEFYTDIVGLTLLGKTFNGKAAVLSGGSTHHELMLISVDNAPPPLQGKRLGLYHSGWKTGDDMATLKNTYDTLIRKHYPVQGLSDHTISQSIYLQDPDGNEVELYVDDPEYDWKENNQWMQAPVKPLDLG